MASKKVPKVLRSFVGYEASSFFLVLQVWSRKFPQQAHLSRAICAGFVHSGAVMMWFWPLSMGGRLPPCVLPWPLNAHLRALKKFGP